MDQVGRWLGAGKTIPGTLNCDVGEPASSLPSYNQEVIGSSNKKAVDEMEMWAPAYIAMQDNSTFDLSAGIKPSDHQELVQWRTKEALHQEEAVATPSMAIGTSNYDVGVPAGIDLPDATDATQQSDDSNKGLAISRSNLQESTTKGKEVPASSGNGHSEKATSIMRDWFNSRSPYVNRKDEDAWKMVGETGLYWDQVQTWFRNERSSRKKSGNDEGLNLESKTHFPEHSIRVLKEFWTNQGQNPSRKQKKWLAGEANLDLDQVSSWFMNSRKKIKLELLQKN